MAAGEFFGHIAYASLIAASVAGPDARRLVTDDVDARLRAFARLLVRAGVNLAEGQELLVHAQHEHAPFVRALAEEAYAAGARFVDVAYADRWVQRAFVEAAPDEMLGWTPPWMVARLERAIEVGAAVIGISADSGAEVFEGSTAIGSPAPASATSTACGWTASWAASWRGRSSPTRPRAGRARRWASRTSTPVGRSSVSSTSTRRGLGVSPPLDGLNAAPVLRSPRRWAIVGAIVLLTMLPRRAYAAVLGVACRSFFGLRAGARFEAL